MDKKKTGNLIREARQRKNYTQNELGLMLGVTNKAVSRWENGESFPDIGVLEQLAAVLELPIENIVTGECSADEKQAVTEVVRLAKLQKRWKQRKQRQIIICMVALGILFCTCMTGYSVIMFVENVYAIPPILVLILLYVGVQQSRTDAVSIDRKSHWVTFLAGISLLIAVVPAYVIFLAVADKRLSRAIVGAKTGPILNVELIIILIFNALLLVYEIYRMLAGQTGLHAGCVLLVTAMYLCEGYRDMLYRMYNPTRVLRILNDRTGVYLAEGLLCIAVLLFLGKRAERKKQKES